MPNFDTDETFYLGEIAAMPRGMTLAEAEHYLMTDELPLDDPFRDISHTLTPEERQAQEDEQRAAEIFDTDGLSPDEVIAFLTGEPTITAAVLAAAQVHTGAMIALVPSVDDAGRLAVSGGLPADQLHCTIKYLGEAADIENQDEILRRIEAAATTLDVIDAEGFALALFNPPGYSQDRDPCTVLLVSGDELSESYEFICHMVHSAIDESYSHMPWVPHITLSETGDADLTPLIDQVGPVTFDRIRVAFAGENYDFPLGSGQTGANQSELETSEPPQAPEQYTAGTEPTAEFESVFDLDHPDVQGWLNEYIAWAKERGVRSPGPVGHQLRDYWVRGPGAAKIRWNTEGDGTRCIKLLTKHVGKRHAGGLCQYYHQLATGTVMGRHPGRPTEAREGDVIPFDFDKDQSRWPAGAPGGLGGQWRDTSPGGLSISELVNHVWEARNAPAGKKILSGVDSHGAKHDLMSNGNGTISAYNDYGDDAIDTFYEKDHLIEWIKLEGQYGGGDDVTWDKLMVPDAPKSPSIKVINRVKVSSPPDTTSSPELRTSLEKLTKVTGSDHVKTDDITSGQVGVVSKITTKDGTYIRKENNSWGVHPAKDITDAEELVSELGIRIGARVPAVERVNKTTVHIGFVDGQTAAEHEAFGVDVNSVPDQKSSRMLGLLDLMTLNGDRHEGNWMVNENDDPPVAYGIDHGLSWASAHVDPLLLKYQPHLATQVPEDKHVENWMSHVDSPFVPNFVPYDELFSRRDIERARSALDAMEPRFIEMGKQRWLATSRRILALIEDQINFTLSQQAV